ncbi:3-oxoacyl-[acyl-carrier protein] reductase [Pseudomonas citronellolis]|uniref:3-oxoacyl-[acyl-carrier protein] reductase n=1 Tax=Pseudomonas citronellolis TaxID=53408 RepID=A0AAQ1HNT1_9PSED|nr:SDR family oxidoreductase [Pseudomonas citronellolis]MCP1603105.1 3-oxoacyl-[acyl-carrier protein] reductase [Pseudomonas citronellolis]MCP1654163.1 3-oxoacyl-[acyl-carrier protein] reductase [Pseudomonas citronellolis]MCP1720940.1 3-oxoacyl-[acyl-carrier protein] reductase [Pseudomonas citronellolis]UUC52669.1 SDR family oxidoreductase [Pseudomonas citronellolis]UXJ50490.1 SDR family oxidoreductase [Pseudomonas citronellolis]
MGVSLQGRVAVVSGGAGGIGAAICRTLAAAGANLVVGYNSSREPALRLVEELAETGGAHCALPVPVTDSVALAGLAAEVERRYGRCDLLVNCAGTTRYVPHDDLDGLDDELFERILATNVRGPFATLRALRPLLQRSDAALVVNISSIAAVSAMGSNVAYCASKAALDNMTRSLARALAPAIRVVSVSPGLADTEFVQRMDRAWRDEQAERTPLRRLAEPREVADAVLAAATHLTFTTGAVIPVDGGRPLS